MGPRIRIRIRVRVRVGFKVRGRFGVSKFLSE